MSDLFDPLTSLGISPLTGQGDPMSSLFTEGGTSKAKGAASHSVGKPNQDIMGQAMQAETEAARSMQDIAGELWGTGEGIRPVLQGSYENMLAGGMTGAESPLYRAMAPSVGSQFDVAARNVAEAGGGQGAMDIVSEGRGDNLSNLMAKSAMDDYSKLFGVAFGQPGTALSGHFGAGSIFGNVADQQAAQQAQFNQQMGDVGTSMGMMFA
jgi:hypothetical protein